MQDLWNQRYSSEDYSYGKEPNQFLKEELEKIIPGNILFLGEGEGRNAVFAASNGWNVDAVDFSEEGKRKAIKLANEIGVKFNYDVKCFSDFTPKENYYDAVGIIFIHLEEDLRRKIFRDAIYSLKPGGRIIFECFEKDQINYQSGGPKKQELLYSLEDIAEEFIELSFVKFSKEEIELSEGIGHTGKGIVIRFVGFKQLA